MGAEWAASWVACLLLGPGHQQLQVQAVLLVLPHPVSPLLLVQLLPGRGQHVDLQLQVLPRCITELSQPAGAWRRLSRLDHEPSAEGTPASQRQHRWRMDAEGWHTHTSLAAAVFCMFRARDISSVQVFSCLSRLSKRDS